MSGQARDGHVGWLALALGLEALSFLGHVILFRAVSIDADSDTAIGLRASDRDHACRPRRDAPVRVSAGAGGIALTAWALKNRAWRRVTSPPA